jgi:hypothetical protein
MVAITNSKDLYCLKCDFCRKKKGSNGWECLLTQEIGYPAYADAFDRLDNCPIQKDTTPISVPVKHGYWTGRTFIDDACAEGFPQGASEELRAKLLEDNKHVTHCSVCGGMFDDRMTRNWKGCPYCLSILDLPTPDNAYSLAWETRRASMEESARRHGYVIEW